MHLRFKNQDPFAVTLLPALLNVTLVAAQNYRPQRAAADSDEGCARVHLIRTVNACVHTPICTALSSLCKANGSRAIVNS